MGLHSLGIRWCLLSCVACVKLLSHRSHLDKHETQTAYLAKAIRRCESSVVSLMTSDTWKWLESLLGQKGVIAAHT